MFKRSKLTLQILLFFSLMFLQISKPIIILAENSPEAEKEPAVSLFQTLEQITINSDITILENTYLYGIEDDDQILIQFEDEKISIPIYQLERKAITEDSPAYHTYSEETLIIKESFPTQTILYD